MSEYTEVEQPFLQQLETLGWTIIDQGQEIPQNPIKTLRQTFRQWLLPDVFAQAVSVLFIFGRYVVNSLVTILDVLLLFLEGLFQAGDSLFLLDDAFV